jgi:aminopeptidase N
VLWWEHKLGRDERDYLLFEKGEAARGGSALKRPVVDRRYERPWDMFDERAYPKGGWVLHMLRSRLGDEDFFGSLQRYGTVYAYESAETADLRKIFERMTGYSLERFFYDWTERPGHPVLKVKTAYQPDDKLVRIDIAQTQDGEAFHFPLDIVLHSDKSDGGSDAGEGSAADPRTLRLDIAEKERTVYLPLASPPTLVRIDPEFTLLAEIQEDKSRDLWEAQALRAPTVPERIRAVRHFGEGKRPADVELLERVLKDDPFWGVRGEAAKVLGKAGTDAARDALTAALDADGPGGAKVRRAAAEALGKFVGDAKAVAALERKWSAGDASYFVEAAVLEALSKADRTPKAGLFVAGLERDSHTEVIRQAALKGLGRSREPAALDTLLEWAGRGRPREARVAALAGAADFLRRNDVTTAQTEQVIERLVESLDSAETPKVRQAAVDALRDLGRTARPALAAVEALAEHDPNGRVRTAAEKAAQAIRTEAAPADELTRLRERVDELQEENENLGDRLIKLEAK